ncbi:MAG: efflux RND transporter periplasmic adaptor subunit [Chloroflexota bacterium]
MKRYLQYGIPATLLLIALAGVVFLFSQDTDTADAQTETSPTVEQRDVIVEVDGTGTISPERTLFLSFSVAETVADVNVEIGDTVLAGDVLASLTTENLQLQVDLAQEGVNASQANLDMMTEDPTALELAQANASIANAQASLASAILAQDTSDAQILVNCVGLTTAEDGLKAAQDAYDDYVDAGFEVDPNFLPDPDSQAGTALRDAQNNYDVTVAQCDITTANVQNDANVDAARAQLEQAELALEALQDGATETELAGVQSQVNTSTLQLQQAQNQLEDATLIAPFDGLVTDVAIVADQQVGMGTVAVTLVDNSQLHVITQIDELDIVDVEIGQTAEITLDALPNTVLNGAVSRITPVANTQQGITTYDVRVDLTDSNEDVMLGMSADVNIQVATLDNVFVVPRRAIQRNDELGEFITVVQDGEEVDVAVTPGYSADGVIVIEGDLTAGQTVVIVEED